MKSKYKLATTARYQPKQTDKTVEENKDHQKNVPAEGQPKAAIFSLYYNQENNTYTKTVIKQKTNQSKS